MKNDWTTGWEDVVNRACVLYKDGKYHMWYTGQSKNISKIGYAVSDDGYNFIKKSNPVLIPELDFENTSVMNPYVLYNEENHTYNMWYAAGETYEPDVIAYATSEDGLVWHKYENNPIITKSKDKSYFDTYKIGGCEVHKLNTGKYLMFYIGYTDINTARIFIAKSNDGVTNWEKSKYPIISPTKGEFDGDACYKPSALYDDRNARWMVWYNGRRGNKEYIGLYFFDGYNIPLD